MRVGDVFVDHNVETLHAITAPVGKGRPGLWLFVRWQEADERGDTTALDTRDLGGDVHGPRVVPRPATFAGSKSSLISGRCRALQTASSVAGTISETSPSLGASGGGLAMSSSTVPTMAATIEPAKMPTLASSARA